MGWKTLREPLGDGLRGDTLGWDGLRDGLRGDTLGWDGLRDGLWSTLRWDGLGGCLGGGNRRLRLIRSIFGEGNSGRQHGLIRDWLLL